MYVSKRRLLFCSMEMRARIVMISGEFACSRFKRSEWNDVGCLILTVLLYGTGMGKGGAILLIWEGMGWVPYPPYNEEKQLPMASNMASLQPGNVTPKFSCSIWLPN